MHAVVDSIVPWVVLMAYMSFAYIAFIWNSNRPKERQLISKSAFLTILIAGFFLVFVSLLIKYHDPSSQTWALFGF